MAAAVRAFGPPACPPQAPQSSEAWYGLFSVVLPCPHSTTSRPNSPVSPHRGQGHLGGARSSSERLSTVRLGRRNRGRQVAGRCRSLPGRRRVSVLAAASGAAAQPAASASVNGAARASFAAWKADSAPGQAGDSGQPAGRRGLGIRGGRLADVVARFDQHRAQVAGLAAEQVGEPDGDREENQRSRRSGSRRWSPGAGAGPPSGCRCAGDHLGVVGGLPAADPWPTGPRATRPVVALEGVLPQHLAP